MLADVDLFFQLFSSGKQEAIPHERGFYIMYMFVYSITHVALVLYLDMLWRWKTNGGGWRILLLF